ncbi:hypothetical protein [Polaribacter uvawellassae]|uniref:hypothetical protein n=1 Tax=Polaribacter uvawellassae TaxID=3133495 RepID=UPI00321975B1
MFNWDKLGRVFEVDENYSWMNSHTTPIAVLYIDNVIRVYFSTRSKIDKKGNFISNSSYIDLDKNDPTKIIYIHDKPLFDLGDFGAFDEFGVMVTDVVHYKDKVYLYYAGWQRLGGDTAAYQVMLGLGVSTDNGKTFSKISKGPIMSVDYYDHISIGNVGVIVENDDWKLYYTNLTQWVLSGKKPTYEYEIKYATSKDGIFWNKTNKVVIGVENRFGAATPTIHKINNNYHMWFGYRKAYDKEDKVGGYRMGYASSKDGVKWLRNDDISSIKTSDKGWDSEMVCYPDVVKVDDNYYMFYCGNGFGKEGFGVAKLVL